MPLTVTAVDVASALVPDVQDATGAFRAVVAVVTVAVPEADTTSAVAGTVQAATVAGAPVAFGTALGANHCT